jgi:hypothetical protein
MFHWHSLNLLLDTYLLFVHNLTILHFPATSIVFVVIFQPNRGAIPCVPSHLLPRRDACLPGQLELYHGITKLT